MLLFFNPLEMLIISSCAGKAGVEENIVFHYTQSQVFSNSVVQSVQRHYGNQVQQKAGRFH